MWTITVQYKNTIIYKDQAMVQIHCLLLNDIRQVASLARKQLNHRIVHLSSSSLRDFFKRPTSKLAKVITVAFARISCVHNTF